MSKIADEFIYETATMDEKAKYWHTHETGTTLREFLGMSQDEYDAWMISGKEPGTPLRRAIAIDFDGCLFHTEATKIVAPNWDVMSLLSSDKLKRLFLAIVGFSFLQINVKIT